MTEKEQLEHLAGRLDDTVYEIAMILRGRGVRALNPLADAVDAFVRWVREGKEPDDRRRFRLLLPIDGERKRRP